MKKNKLVTSTASLIAFMGASALTVACKAPGSSRGIDASDPVGDKYGNNPGGPTIKPIDPGKEPLPEVKPEPIPAPNPETPATQLREVSPVFIQADQKIKLVALGDSITAGFDGGLLQDYPGQMVNGQIEGASYPAFLAQLLNQNNRVESFGNYAASGARAIDWIMMLGANYQNPYSDSPTWDKLDQTFAGRRGFGQFKAGYAQEVANDTIAALKDANLVTLSIGANDFFYLLTKHLTQANPMQIINELKKPNPDYLLIYKFVNDAIKATIPEVATRVKILIDRIAELAPQANINLVTYPMPMSGLKKSLDDFIQSLIKTNLPLDPVVVLLDQINLPFKQVDELLNQEFGNKNRVSIVNAYNSKYWSSHSADLSDVYFDIHPNTNGYKKLALDMYLKMTNPSVNISHYDPNFDLNKAFIESDALTLKYEIAVTQSPVEVIGNSTQAYLEKSDPFLDKINQTRSPYNYGERLLRMSQTFKNITVEAILALTSSTFYKQLDPEGKLAELILDSENNGENGFESIIQEIIDEKILQKIMGDFQAELTKRNKAGVLKLSDIPNIFISSALTDDNLFRLINALAKSNFINHNKAGLADALTTVIDNLFKKNQDFIAQTIVKGIKPTLEKAQIAASDVEGLIKTIISSSQLNQIINALIKTFISNSAQFQTVNNYPELIKAFLSDETNIKQVANSLSTFAWDILNNPTIKATLQDIVWKLINQYHVNSNLTQEQSNAFISSLLDNITQFKGDKTDKFIADFISQFLMELRNTEFNKLDIALNKAFRNALNNLLGKDDIQGSLSPYKAINILVESNLIASNKDFLKQLLHNVIEQAPNLKLGNVIYSVLPASAKSVLAQDGFITLFNVLISNEHSNAILISALDHLIDNFNTLKDSNDLGTLVANILKTQDLATLKTHLKAIGNELLTQESIQDTIITLLRKSFEKIKEPANITDNEISNFLKDFRSEGFNFISQLKFIDPLIDTLFDSLTKIKDSATPYVELKALTQALLNSLKQTALSDPWALVDKLADSKTINQNKEFIKKLVSYLFTSLNKNNELIQQIHSLAQNALNKANIEQYVDKGEINALLDQIFKQSQINSFIPALANYTIDHIDYIKLAKNPNELLVKLFSDATFKELIKNQIQPIIPQLVPNFKAPKTIFKLVKYLAQSNNIKLEAKYDGVIEKLISNALDNIWNKDKIVSLINSLLEQAIQTSDVNAFVKSLPNLIKDNVEINAFNLVKGLLVVSLDKNELEIYAQLLNSLFAQAQELAKSNEPNILTKLLAKISLPESLKEYNIQASDIAKFVIRILQSNSLNKLANAITSSVISNQEALNKATNFKELGLVFLKDATFIEQIKQVALRIFAKYNEVPEFVIAKNAFVSIAAKVLSTNEQTAWIFAHQNDDQNTELKALLGSAYDLLIKSQDKLNIIEILFSGIEKFANDGNVTTYASLGKYIANEFAALFKGANLENNVIKLLHLFGDSLLKQHATYLKQIITNVYNKIATDDSFIDQIYQLLPQNIKDLVAKYATKENITTVVKFIFSNENIKAIFTKQLSNVLAAYGSFENINSFNDLLKVTFGAVDFKTISSNVTNFLTAFFADNKVKEALISILDKVAQDKIEYIYTQGIKGNNNLTKEFITSVVNNFLPLVKELNLYDSMLQVLFDSLEQAKSASDITSEIKAIGPKLLAVLSTEFKKDPSAFINKISASPIITNNNEYLKLVAKILVTKYIKSPELISLINKQIQNNEAKITPYTTVEHLQALVDKLLNDSNTLVVLIDAIEAGLSLKDLGEIVTNPMAGSYQLVKNSNLFAHSLELSKFIKLVLNSETLTDLLENFINKFLISKNVFTPENTFPREFYSGVRKTLVALLEQDPSLLNKFFTLAKEQLPNSNSWIDLVTNIAPKLGSLFNLSDFAFVKTILNSDVWAYSDKLNVFVDRVFNSDTANGLYDTYAGKLVAYLPIEKIAAKLNITDQDKINQLFNKLIVSKQFKTILHETIKAIVTNANNTAHPELSLNAANNYNDLVRILVSNDAFIAKIKPQVLEIISQAINQFGVLDVLKDIITQAIKNEKVAFVFKDIEPDRIDSLISNILSLYDIVDTNFGISNLLFETVISYMKLHGANFSKLNIGAALSSLFKDKIAHDANHEFEAKIVKTFASISGSKLFSENKPEILQILQNIFGNLSQEAELSDPEIVALYGDRGPKKAIELTHSILKLIPQATLEKIYSFVDKQDFEKFFVFVLTNQNFQGVVTKSINNLIENMDQFSSVTSYADIIKKVVTLVDLDSLRSDLIGFINDLLTNQSVQHIAQNALIKGLKALGVDTDSYSEEKLATIKALSQNLKPLLDKVELINETINIVFEGLKAAGNETDSTQVIAKFALIPQQITHLIDEKVKKDPLAFVNKILNLEFIKPHYTSYIEIMQDVVFALIKSGKLQNIVTQQITSLNSKLFEYVDRQHFANLINFILGEVTTQNGQVSVAQNEDILTLLAAYFNLIKEPNFLQDGDSLKLDPNKFIAVLKNEQFQQQAKNSLKSILNRVLASKQFSQVVVDATNAAAKIFHIDLGTVDRDKLTQDLLSDTIKWLESTKSLDAVLNALINTAVQFANNESKPWKERASLAVKDLSSQLLKIFNFKKYKFIQAFFEQANNLPKNKDAIIKLVDIIYDDISKRDDVIYQIITISGLNKYLDKFDLKYDLANKDINADAKSGEIIELIKEVLNLPQAKAFIHVVLEDVLSQENWDKFAQIKLPANYQEGDQATAQDDEAYSKLIQALVSDPKFKQAAVSAIRNWIYQINKSDNFVKILSKVLHKVLTTLDVSSFSGKLPLINQNKGTDTIPAPEITSMKFAQLFDGITNPEPLLAVLINNLSEFDTNLDLIPQLLDSLIELVKDNGLNISTSDFANKLLALGKSIYSNPNFQAKVLESLKTNALAVKEKNLQQDVYTFFRNVTKFATSNISIGTIAWNLIPQDNATIVKIKQTLNINDEEFNTIGLNFKFFIDQLMNNDRIPGLVENISKWYLENPNQIEGITDWFNGLQKYLNVKENEQATSKAIIDLLKSVLNDNQYARNIAHLLVNKALVFAGLDYSTDTQGKQRLDKMVNLFVDNLGTLFEETDMFKSIIGSIVNTIKSANGFKDFTSKVGLAIFNGLEFTEFKTAKKFLKASLIVNNKDDIVNITQELITKLLTSSANGKKGKIEELIHTFNVGNMLLDALMPKEKQAELSSENRAKITASINDMLVEAVAQPGLANLLITLLKDIFDRADVYTNDQHNSYSSMLSELFNSPKSEEIKKDIKDWFTAILSNRDNIISKGVAVILQNVLSNSLKIDFSSQKDYNLLQNVASGLFKTIVGSPELDQAVNGIYQRIKETRFEQSPNRMKDLTNAIIKGALSVITTEDGNNISLGKILDKNEFLAKLLENIGADNYVTLINRLFESSSLENNTGMYKIIKGVLNIPAENNAARSAIEPTEPGETRADEGLQNQLKFGFKVDVSLFSVPGKFKALIKALYYPLFKYQMSQVMSDKVDVTGMQYVKSEGYKAMYRLTATLLLLVKEKGNVGSVFWNWSGISIEGFYRDGMGDAYNAMKDEIPGFDSIPSDKRVAMGAQKYNTKYNKEFIFGNTSSGTNLNNYWSDQLLVYVWWFGDKSAMDKYSDPKVTIQQSYFEALKRGYLIPFGTKLK
ncbi:GDSL-type esterase/lipase family protein [Mycoplasma sp. Sp48II]|uniref:GDSL-type esterase/lipase family protein n=1 Tax=Mycoplasma sp. Sp48II TaxID=3401682 RepID=UPI003AAFBF4F